jgi:hypothetical protein
MRAQIILRISSVEPTKVLGCAIYFDKPEEWVRQKIWNEFETDMIDLREAFLPYECSIIEHKIEKFKTMFFSGEKYDPYFLTSKESNTLEWIYDDRFKLMAVQPYCTDEFHYYLGEFEENVESGYEFPIFIH